MSDSKYCYPDSDVLINMLNIKDKDELFETEVELTSLRVKELQRKPIKGKFDFKHLKAIHQYIFQDVYEWAGKERTVEIGKGNLFCTVVCIQDYARSVFGKYFPQCQANKDNFDDFVRVLAENYGDLNALHPFREGNGRAQREFARLVCLECGYDFDLQCTTQKEMLAASKLSFDKGDSSGFINIFSKALHKLGEEADTTDDHMKILSADDLLVGASEGYDYYGYGEYEEAEVYDEIYKARISKMDAEKTISEARNNLAKSHAGKKKHLTKGYSVIEDLHEKQRQVKEQDEKEPPKKKVKKKGIDL